MILIEHYNQTPTDSSQYPKDSSLKYITYLVIKQVSTNTGKLKQHLMLANKTKLEIKDKETIENI